MSEIADESVKIIDKRKREIQNEIRDLVLDAVRKLAKESIKNLPTVAAIFKVGLAEAEARLTEEELGPAIRQIQKNVKEERKELERAKQEQDRQEPRDLGKIVEQTFEDLTKQLTEQHETETGYDRVPRRVGRRLRSRRR